MAKQEIDEHAVIELTLYIDNDSRLHAQWEAIVRNMWRHKNKDRFSASRAVDGFMYVVDAAVKRYKAEYGEFTIDRVTRRAVAEGYVDSFERNARDERRLAPPVGKQVCRVGTRCFKV